MRIYLDSIGCRLNHSEIEKYASEISAAGHVLVSQADDAEVIVINTCAVTSAAASDSRQKMRKLLQNEDVQVIATGCLTAIEPDIFDNLHNLTIVPNLEKDDLVACTIVKLRGEDSLNRESIPGSRSRTRAFIKAQDGCDNHCTYCITRIARGKARSIPVDTIQKDILSALRRGVNEVVLTGVHLGAWGFDLLPKLKLKDLLRSILSIPGEYRIRLSSIEPWELDADFFSLWLEDERLCRHFHLPLQSGSGKILRRMARNTTPEKFALLVDLIRSILPDASITTDVIVGFPGESDLEFTESLGFVRKIGFSGGHVFSYSARKGTLAASFSDHVSSVEKKTRSSVMRLELERSAVLKRLPLISTVVPVLWEGMRKTDDGLWRVSGLTSNNHRVNTITDKFVSNQVLLTKLVELTDNGFLGEIVTQEMPAEH
jgi:threonylcarbamoyladenosine tRNA methylthiotransferase MtaB